MIPDFFSSFFSSYILLSITTLVILLGSIYLYINHRIADQDHKLASMVNVIQGIIYDTQVIKSQLIGGGGAEGQGEVDGGNSTSSVVELDGDINEAKIVVSDDDYSDSESNMSSDSDSTATAMVEVEAEAEAEPYATIDAEVMDIESDPIDSLHAATNEDGLIKVKTNDFKKMSVGALRELVQEQGLCEDASKLKKPELLQLLA